MQGLLDRVEGLLEDGGSGGSREIEEEVLVKHAIEKARQELQAARSFFENVAEEDMVDHAIYSLQAAERKYDYLLKYARKMGYRQQFLWGQTIRKEEG